MILTKKVPLHRQLESVDCGPTCICMIADYYGKRYKLKTLKKYTQLTRIGLSLRDLVDCCNEIGFKASSVRVSLSELDRMPMPAILYWKQSHYVVIDEISRTKKGRIYSILDPGYGRVKLSEEDFIKSWASNEITGLAIVMEPMPNFLEINPEIEENNNNRSLRKSVMFFLKKYKKRFRITLLLSTLALSTNWIMPILLQKTIDMGVMKKDMNIVFFFLIAQMFCFIGYVMSSGFTNIALSKIGFRINIDLTSKYLMKLISLPMKFFDTRFSSDLIQKMDDQNRIKTFLTTSLDTTLFASLNLVVFSSILLYYNTNILLIFLFFSVITVVLAIQLLKRRKYIDYSLFTNLSIQDNTIYELVHGMPEIKINNAQNRKIEQWEETQDKINALSLKSLYIDYYLSSGTAFLDRLRDIVITGVCAYYVIYADMTIGMMMTISYLLGQLSGPIREFINFSKTIQDAKLSFDRLEEIDAYPSEESGKKRTIDKIEKGIRLDNVSFKYEGSFCPYVLKNINLNIEKGKITAIVGVSGCGKTTLIKLLLSFYAPQEGGILLDDQNLKSFDSDIWRQKCGAVMQDGYIYSGTIAENIALADEKPNMERVCYASKVACIDTFIEELPMKYHTKIGKTGIELSGGQKQRLFIARAVYKNPEFLFFDEATSSLDANNEREIMMNLSEFYKNKTVVVVAHRLSTVKNADKIVFIDKGCIVEEGTHQELSALKGAYYMLVKNQLELGR